MRRFRVKRRTDQLDIHLVDLHGIAVFAVGLDAVRARVVVLALDVRPVAVVPFVDEDRAALLDPALFDGGGFRLGLFDRTTALVDAEKLKVTARDLDASDARAAYDP